MKNYNQDNEARIITNALLKAVIAISVCVMLAFGLHSCELDSDTVADCRDACESSSTQMQSVTPYKCVCIENNVSPSPWVIN